MNVLWKLLAISLIIAFVIQARDKRINALKADDMSRDRLFTMVLVLYLGIFCGLRTWYNDTVTYIGVYETLTPTLDHFVEDGTYTFASGIGFSFLNSLMKTIGFSTQDFLMFYSVITTACYVRFVRKHTNNVPFAVFLMFTTGFYTFVFAAIKQCMATAICLIGLEFLMQKKKALYILFVFLASLFHPYALVYLLLLLMDFRPLTWKTYLYFTIFIVGGFGLDSLLGTIVDVTAMMGANYDMTSFAGEGVNIFRVLVCFVPISLALVCGQKLFASSTRRENILFNMAMLNALIMFVGLFGTANYFARLANYFLPAQVVVLPWMFKKLVRRDRQILTALCVIGYTGYFIYGNLIQSVFDKCFSKITLLEYISSHFGA